MKKGDWRINPSSSVTSEGRRKNYARVRGMALAAVGLKCAYCGYNKDHRALQIDHVDGGGNVCRSTKRGVSYYYHILKTLTKIKYQTLCANCNMIKRSTEGACERKKWIRKKVCVKG